MDKDTNTYVKRLFCGLSHEFPLVWETDKCSTSYLGSTTRYRLFASGVDVQISNAGSHFDGYIFHEMVVDSDDTDAHHRITYKVNSIYEDTGENNSVVYPVSVTGTLELSRGVDSEVQRIKAEILESLQYNAENIAEMAPESFVHACYWHSKHIFSGLT